MGVGTLHYSYMENISLASFFFCFPLFLTDLELYMEFLLTDLDDKWNPFVLCVLLYQVVAE